MINLWRVKIGNKDLIDDFKNTRDTSHAKVFALLKDVRAKIFHFFKFILHSDNELLVSEVQKKKKEKKEKKIGGHRIRFRDKACGKLP